MGRKDHEDDEPLADLDKDTRKRLEKLGGEWDKEARVYVMEKLTLPDLRLLLTYFPPLRELIRQIAALGPGATLSGAWEEARAASDPAKTDGTGLRDELAAMVKETTGLRRQLAAEQQRCRALEDKFRRQQQTVAEQARELARRPQPVEPPTLATLREDTTLANRLGLADLPDDSIQALIRTVAVLSQMSSIERLWDSLKEGCEREQRPAGAEVQQLLADALTWHNHNWRQKPYVLQTAAVGDPYDFARQQRVGGRAGETVAALWLPGIADSTGKALRKALVATR